MKEYYLCEPENIDKFILCEYFPPNRKDIINLYGENSCLVSFGKCKKKKDFMDQFKVLRDIYPNTLIVTLENKFYGWITGKKQGSLDGYVIYEKNCIKGIKNTFNWTNKYLINIIKDTINRFYSNKEPITPYEKGFNYRVINQKEILSLDLKEPIAIDVETYGGLRVNESKLYTIAFTDSNLDTYSFKYKPENKDILIKFLNKYKQQIYHNASYDLKVFITNLFMKDISDLDHMLDGLLWVKSLDLNDTMLMIYSKFNSAQGNELGLKFNSLHLSGSYALDVTDVTKYPVEQILEYNAIDTWNTMKLYQKHKDIINRDSYIHNIKSIAYLLEEMIVGLPVSKEKLDEVYNTINQDFNNTEQIILSNSYVSKALDILIDSELKKRNSKLKTKQLIAEDIELEFNPGSNIHLQTLLYDVCKLPVIEYTDTRQPSTSGDTLKTLHNYTKDKDILDLLDQLKNYFDANKILTGFLKPIKKYIFYRANTSTYWLTGNHKLGGTISNRLSSSDINLANTPSNSKYGKLFKSIFVAPNDWLFTGSDFSALEDRIVANISNDPMKIGVFTKGIDGHSLNASGYFEEELKERDIVIDKNDPESINSIKKLAPDLRQASKSYTFGLNYNQEPPGMSKSQGISLEKATKIYNGYRELYSTLVQWNESNKQFMNKNGYVEGCWGHKVHTPLIKLSLINRRITPSKVKAEFRSGNNAITQSYGMLTTIAGYRFQDKLFNSKYRYDVLLINQIHDAIYLLIRNDPEVIEWVNKTLIETMCIMDEPRLINAQVRLESELEVGTSWQEEITLKNNISKEEIKEIIKSL
jgi:DNA polymerase-1